ncbi:response regulator transcription factor [Carnobacterium maltaromaticum]|uniref:Response regulator transcription factor n=1 Tax=Carnobacterium maltaromaticum TaxID=2751 RepID=A0AAW9KA93_CARML|nr:response regulator transcription factor [Carnobacterium maltaromaticum]
MKVGVIILDKTIVVVEDDVNTNEVISVFLRENGYMVNSFDNGEKAYQFILTNKRIDLIIVDVMLPGMDGIELISQIRSFSKVPIIVLTAMVDEQTQLISFGKLADDFVEKPFSLLVLVKRVEAVLRRANPMKQMKTVVGTYTIELDNLKVFNKEEEYNLTVKEAEILYYLIENRGNIVTRKKLIESVWEYDYDVNDRSLDTHIKNLRKKIGQENIITCKGLGYKLCQ